MNVIVWIVLRRLWIAMLGAENSPISAARRKEPILAAAVVVKPAIWTVRILVVIFSDRLAATCHFMMVVWMQNSSVIRKLAQEGVFHIFLKLFGLSPMLLEQNFYLMEIHIERDPLVVFRTIV